MIICCLVLFLYETYSSISVITCNKEVLLSPSYDSDDEPGRQPDSSHATAANKVSVERQYLVQLQLN